MRQQLSAPAARAMAASAVATALVTMPVFLFASLSVPIRAELGFDEVLHGAAVSSFFGVSAAASPSGGWLADRLGAGAAVATGTTLTVLATAVLALAAVRPWHLVVLLAAAGVANAIAQPGANALLAQAVATQRQGLAFGVNQVSAPLAALLAGVAIPTVAVTVGWRWAFTAPLVLGVALLAIWPHRGVPPARTVATGLSLRTALRQRDLLLLTAASALASGGVNAMIAFFVTAAVDTGLAPSAAGWIFVVGSAAGIATRVVYGWRADRLPNRNYLRRVSMLMIVGAVGIAALVPGQQLLLPAAAVVAFGAGWGWNGLFNYSVVSRYRSSPAIALGVATSGVFIGGALGSLTFGALAGHYGFALAWGVAAACLVTAGLLIRVVAPPHADPAGERAG
ncbi:MFS transporter [Micromonospora sp. FIMYZ51]|uniref:MFS transporter n=1 Tax=Micromonospora sp. FIMYZ51 TaxID=3051832 RepID=UPI00311DF277